MGATQNEKSGNGDYFSQIAAILTREFELDPAVITPDARLYEDLHIDSIDAVDLLVRLKELTGQQLTPESFRSVRTLRDVIAALEACPPNRPE